MSADEKRGIAAIWFWGEVDESQKAPLPRLEDDGTTLPRLERWGKMRCPAGSTDHIHVIGFVYGNPKFNDGDCIMTSPVEWSHWGLNIIRTRNSVYALVGPDRNGSS
jgi:hypothetical protein